MTAEAQRSNFRAFLDGVQYSRNGILRYERIFGPGFVSTGGVETTKVSLLDYSLFSPPSYCLCHILSDCSAGAAVSLAQTLFTAS